MPILPPVTSELGEDSGEVESHECDFKPSSKDVHGLTFEVGAEATQPKVVAMYALPATSAVVTASASGELLSWGDHTNVTI